MNFEELLNKRRILITCGTGGVGKTTLSAALALKATLMGKNTVVITIDPAKRLATSLGLKTLGDHPTDLTHTVLAIAKKLGITPSGKSGKFGKLAAIMPDTRKTFEAFVADLMPNKESAEQVFRNPIFQIFAKEFSGTNEYMALQKLNAAVSNTEYDCIILDTPPSRNTLALLDAPKLLARFFEERMIQWLVVPANKLVSAGMKKARGLLEKLTGAGFMSNLFEFAGALFEVRLTFAANLKKITQLLESEQVGFLLVASPTTDQVQEIGHFIQSVRGHHFHFDGLLLNRSLSYLKVTEEETSTHPEILEGLQILKAIEERETSATRSLTQLKDLSNDSTKSPVYAKLPELARDVHSVEDLFHVALALDRGIHGSAG